MPTAAAHLRAAQQILDHARQAGVEVVDLKSAKM
jgi:hypothetical protein